MKLSELLLEEKPESTSLDYAIEAGRKEAKRNGQEFNIDDPDDRLKTIIPILEAHCSEIVKAYKNNGGTNLLLRGMRYKGYQFASKILTDRKPGFLSLTIHKIVNEAMTKMGLTAHRGNSAFCSTDVNIADSWGSEVYVIFPKDGFTFTTFTKIGADEYLYDKLQDWESEDGETDKEELSRMVGLLKSFDPQNKNIQQWLPHSHEYMIAGDSYIGLEENFYQIALSNWFEGRYK